jgi:hypothetical protein
MNFALSAGGQDMGQPILLNGIVKAVLSGDTLLIMGVPACVALRAATCL